ncbi:MAG: potassium channel family protein [Frankiaceae bacterium]|nr:potassium channel family protein [Frankiaceae bacterium]
MQKSTVRIARVSEKESLEALMHGIFAITMTLLILDLRVPETRSRGHLWESLQGLGPEIAGYAFGFVYLMSVWLSLRNFTRQLRGVTSLLSVVFLLVIGLVSLTPFTVSTMSAAVGDTSDLGTAVRLMSAVVGTSFLLSACMSKLALHQGLVPVTPFRHVMATCRTAVDRSGDPRFRSVLSQPMARHRRAVHGHSPGHRRHGRAGNGRARLA